MIKILYKYIIKIFAKIFLFTIAALSVVIITSELFTYMPLYIEYKASFDAILLHLISNLPEWLVQGLPIATLLAVLFSIGNLSKKNEITAIKASGINTWRIITLFLMTGFIIGLCDFAIREFILPKTSLYAQDVKREKVKKEKTRIHTDFYNQIVSLPNHIKIIMGHFDTKACTMKNVVVEKYNDNFTIKRLILAEKASWVNNTWILTNGVIRDFDINSWHEIYFKSHDSAIHVTPKDLTIEDIPYHAMNIRDFKKYINKLKVFGQTATKAKIILYIRFSAIFSHIIVMMIGIPFTIGFGSKLNKMLSFSLALGVAFTYWGMQAITQAFGENFILPVFLAAWLPNAIFSIIGVYFLVKIRK
ncbi:MAG: LptF/LptG family permease [Endomicrobium sp.]|jgi:lipopolysaccharide export system permease protein|nr:LptF/LptG family permease [Endomicrobium sp.]